MNWHYQIRRRENEHGPWYEICEVYSNPQATTIGAMAPVSETRKGLIKVLEMMLHDAKKYKTLRG